MQLNNYGLDRSYEKKNSSEKVRQENGQIISYLEFREQYFRHILGNIKKIYKENSIPHGVNVLQHNIYNTLNRISDLKAQITRAEEMMNQGVHVMRGFFQQDFNDIEKSIRQIEIALKNSKNHEMPQLTYQESNIHQTNTTTHSGEKTQAILRYLGNPPNFREYVNRIDRIKARIGLNHSENSGTNIQNDIRNLSGDLTIVDRFRKKNTFPHQCGKHTGSKRRNKRYGTQK